MRGILRAVSYRASSAELVRQPTIASLKVPLILSFGPTIRVLDAAGHDRVLTSFVAGPDDRHGMTEFAGEQHGMQIDFTPLGARMLLGVPMHELARQAVDLGDLLGADGRRLVEQLAETPHPAARSAIIAALVTERLAEAQAPSPAARFVWERLVSSGGRVPIGALAERLGCSPRYLISEFRSHVGLPPKAAARVLRFERARRLLDRRDGRRIADVAAACGYYDQAHLNRDFRAFAGTTPGEYVTAAEPQAYELEPAPTP